MECQLPDPPATAVSVDEAGPTRTLELDGITLEAPVSWERSSAAEQEAANQRASRADVLSGDSISLGLQGLPMLTASFSRSTLQPVSVRRSSQAGADSIRRNFESRGWAVSLNIRCQQTHCDIEYDASNESRRTKTVLRRWIVEGALVEATCTGTSEGYDLVDQCVLPEPPSEALSVDHVVQPVGD